VASQAYCDLTKPIPDPYPPPAELGFTLALIREILFLTIGVSKLE